MTLPCTTLLFEQFAFESSPPKFTPWPFESITLPVIIVPWAVGYCWMPRSALS